MSTDNQYEIIFSGEIRSHFSSQQASRLLIKKAGLSNASLQTLVERSPCRIKSFKSLEKAKGFIKALWQMGWHTSLNVNHKQLFCTKIKERSLDSSGQSGKTVTLPELEFESLVFPSDWRPVSGLNQNASLQARCTTSESYCISIAQRKSDFRALPKHSSYAKAIVNDVCQKMASVYVDEFCQMIKIDHSQSNAYLSELYVASGTSENHSVPAVEPKLAYLIAVFEGRQAFYSLYFWCAKSDYQVEKQTFLRIIESFELGYRNQAQVA